MSPQNTPDEYAREGKRLASLVKQLRGWVSTDAAKAPALADALNELVAHRLSAYATVEAGADVQEGVVSSARLMSAHGPLGAYTQPADSARYLTAATHFGTVQARLGAPGAGGRTVGQAVGLVGALPASPFPLVPDRTAVWALGVQASGHVAAGDAPRANAYADAALARLRSGSFGALEGPALTIDTHRAVADARWAAGREEQAVEHSLAALRAWRDWVGDDLRRAQSLSEGHARRLAGPAAEVFRDAADRLLAVGRVDEGLAVRRESVSALEQLGSRLGASVQGRQVGALSDLAHDLLAASRVDEATVVAERAMEVARRLLGREKTRQAGSAAVVEAAPGWARALVESGRAGAASEGLQEALGLLSAAGRPTDRGGLARYALLIRAFADVQRALGDDDEDATRAELEDVLGELVGAGDDGGPGDAVRDAARGVVPAAAQELAGWPPLDDASALRVSRDAEAEARRVAEAAEARRVAAEAARAEAERVAVERAAALRAAADEAEEAARAEAERIDQEHAAAIEAERVAAEREARTAAHEAARAEAQRIARERALVEAQRVAADRAARDEAERVAAEAARSEAEEAARAEAERIAEEDAARAEAERIAADQATVGAAEPVAAEEPVAAREEVVSVEPVGALDDPYLTALADLLHEREAASADRKAARAIQEQVVEVLRRLYERDPEVHRAALVTELEELSAARRRAGDWLSAWGPSREAKQIAKHR